ncbi:JmjC domain-containing protein [Sinorhizobium alkalisoli]|uniref:JmjC domain-containing protein n=1 Tax=Sinorhizobium alkalisoli TaxID=1752398 RepID=UPI00124C8DD3|nr:cupin domain-containing protein [Sinorhizobium alkalisoli]QFI68698.1 Cupin 4 family protein [Sinorhizobium alkalisoli]
MDQLNQHALASLLLGDTPLETFWTENWNRCTHLVTGRGSGTFNGCVTLSELENVISNTRLPLGNFDMAHDQKPLDKSAYCENGLVSPRRVYDLHGKGVTIILRAAHYWLPGLNRLRVAAEKLFGCPVQANVYLTPPDNQSTPPHWDTHDLFVLQIAGSKRWPLFANMNNPRPLGGERFRPGVDPVGAMTQLAELSPGDCLYLPRGEIHAPVSIAYSVHVALGVSSYRWIDIVHSALQQILPPDSILREPVLPSAMSCDLPMQVRSVCKAMKQLANEKALSTIARIMVSSHGDEDVLPAPGRLREIVERGACLGFHDKLKKVAGSHLQIAQRDNRAYLVIGEKTASFPANQRNGLQWLAEKPTVTPADLAEKMGLDEETGLAVAQTLVEEGLLCRA